MHKITIMTVLLITLLFLGGCVVTSIYPYYTDKDLVFDPALLGKWVEAGETNQPAEYVQIERLGDKGYWATVFSTHETNSVELHLFRLKQQLLLDSYPTNRSLDFVPVHQVSKVIRIEPELETANLNYDWLAKLLEKRPKAIRHMMLQDKPEDTQNSRIVLTANTKELQRFILEYMNDTNAWSEPSLFEHLN
jgi:hypothetical protein